MHVPYSIYDHIVALSFFLSFIVILITNFPAAQIFDQTFHNINEQRTNNRIQNAITLYAAPINTSITFDVHTFIIIGHRIHHGRAFMPHNAFKYALDILCTSIALFV